MYVGFACYLFPGKQMLKKEMLYIDRIFENVPG